MALKNRSWTLTPMNSLVLMFALLFPVADLSPAGSVRVQRSALNVPPLQEQSDDGELRVTAIFSEKQSIQPWEQIELLLSRPFKESDERLGILIGNTDVSSLFSAVNLRLRYDAKLWPLPVGESTVTVYLVSKNDEWKELERFTLVVDNESTTSREGSSLSLTNNFEAAFIKTSYFDRFASMLAPTLSVTAESNNRQEPTEPSPQRSSKKGKIKFVPSVTFDLIPRSVQSNFPAQVTPETPLANLTMSAKLDNDVTYGSFSSTSRARFVGHNLQQDAIRYSELGNAAPQVDLADYLFQFQTGPVKYQVGNFSFGDLRHLVNAFPSRGITITVPFLKRFDFSAAAMNGTSIFGYSNFFGLNRRKHQVLGGTLGVEMFPKRPGGLRLEVGVLAGHSQAINPINTGGILDETRTRGFSLRLIANDKAGRFHFEGGFTRSFSIFPAQATPDPDQSPLVLPGIASNAHYFDVSYQILKDFSLSKTRKANLTVGFTEEKVTPEFLSLGASPEKDKINYGFSLNGSVDEITGRFLYTTFHNNLNSDTFQPRSHNGSLSLTLAAPAKALLFRTKDSQWLPGLSYTFLRGHVFDVAIPVNGGFELNLSTLPNLFTINHNFAANWQIKKFTIDYEFERSLQDNEQSGSELKDPTTLINTGKFGVAVNSKIDLNLTLTIQNDANGEDAISKRTYLLGPGIKWKLTNQMTVTGNLSNTIVGDSAKFSHTRDTKFDVSWSYGFDVGKQELKKLKGAFSISYSNGYLHSLDRREPTDNLTKNQALTAKMSFTLF
jgi:hypothetical protein